ncbi:MAG TPA: nucleotidyltransferase domain-containing protein [Asanoa sp.]
MTGDLTDETLARIAERLTGVAGVVAIALGGSRARGAHRPDSDVDLGLYYRGRLDVEGLRALAHEVTGTPTEVTARGGWGPWVDGGGWLTVDGWRVDWIYRDLDRVERIWRDCQEGRYEVGVQPGHPLGFSSHWYAGEVALCRVLADPGGVLGALRDATAAYPPALGQALVSGLWEAEFTVGTARYGARGRDPAYVAGSLFRAVGVACHALHGHDGVWVTTEKGLVTSAGRLPSAPPQFVERVGAVFAGIGADPAAIDRSIDAAAGLVAEVARACGYAG